MRQFRNDYSESAAPQIFKALSALQTEQNAGYTEEDLHCERAQDRIRELCETPAADVEFCIGGTSANVTCLNGLLREWEGVICTPDAHINVHETGALGATGRSVLPTHDTDGFLSVEAAERVWQFQMSTGRHMTRPAAIYLTDTTELGDVWTRDRFDAICAWARSHELAIFLDGARIGSALTSPDNDLTLPHIAHMVDALCLGGTKNGLLMGEAVVISGTSSAAQRLREAFPYLIKERCGLLAKGFLLGAQFEAAFGPRGLPLDQTLYWQLAASAQKCAERLRAGLVSAGYELYGNAKSNQVFVTTSPQRAQAFEHEVGCETFYTLDGGRVVIRFVCSWATTNEDVDELVAFAERQK